MIKHHYHLIHSTVALHLSTCTRWLLRGTSTHQRHGGGLHGGERGRCTPLEGPSSNEVLLRDAAPARRSEGRKKPKRRRSGGRGRATKRCSTGQRSSDPLGQALPLFIDTPGARGGRQLRETSLWPAATSPPRRWLGLLAADATRIELNAPAASRSWPSSGVKIACMLFRNRPSGYRKQLTRNVDSLIGFGLECFLYANLLLQKEAI